MAHGYKTLQHWDHWLKTAVLGKDLLELEQRLLMQLVSKHYGKHALLIGVPQQRSLLQTTNIPCHAIITPLVWHDAQISCIENDMHELPILTGSVDLVILPHTLELIDHPRHLLAEACRIVKPEGLIVVSGFNPYSLWGIRKFFTHSKISPWAGNFIHASKIKNWLRLADFSMEKQLSGLYTPPINSGLLLKYLHLLDGIGNLCFPFLGSIYVLAARAKVIPLTPIRMKWKQQLSGIRISTSIPGHIARRSE